jgi:hypothetical protein
MDYEFTHEEYEYDLSGSEEDQEEKAKEPGNATV